MHPLAPVFLSAVLDGRYRIDTYVDDGNFGIVYKGFDQQEGTVVAIKVLVPTTSAAIIDDFDVEDALLERLSAATHVIHRHDAGTAPVSIPTAIPGSSLDLDVRFIVLELAEDALTKVVVNRASIPIRERLQLFRDYAKGAHQCHLKHVVHRDFKAENGLLVKTPGGHVAKVTDFGRSRHVGTAPRRHADYQLPQGDMRFAPPELLWLLASDDPQHWLQVDLYMLGSVLFELVVGQGLTMTALPLGFASIPAIARPMTRLVREQSFRGALGQMRQDYETAYGLFEAQVPKVIRQPLSRLLRQMTDPDPTKRFLAVQSIFAGPRIPWGLQPILERVDRVIAVLDAKDRQRTIRYRRRVG